jgi:hypothetical protein
MLPQDLKLQAERHARELGVSLGGLIRESLEAMMRGSDGDRSTPFFSDNAVYVGEAPRGLSVNHDGYLYGKKQ